MLLHRKVVSNMMAKYRNLSYILLLSVLVSFIYLSTSKMDHTLGNTTSSDHGISRSHNEKVHSQSGADAWHSDKIVPDVIATAPNQWANIHYGSKSVDQGNELTVAETQSHPTKIVWPHDGDDKTLYTIIMCDPDAPSRADPKFRAWLHWIVENVPGKGHDLQKGFQAVQYQGPAPPKGTGNHRYVFLIYKQQEEIDVKGKETMPTDVTDLRKNFDVAKYLKTLKHMPELVAGNWFLAKHD